MRAYAALKARLLEVNDLTSAACVLEWDQKTYMPAGGAPSRGRRLATLTRLAHARLDRKSTRLNSSHPLKSRMPSSA